MRPISLQVLCACLCVLLFYACSKEELTDSPVDPPPTGTGFVKDADGNSYEIIKVGTQSWFKDNLNTTKFNDGTKIPAVHDPSEWFNLIEPGWSNYQGSSHYDSKDGRFYNWYAVNSGKLCPKGWHVPTEAEWKTLIDYLGGESVAGGKMKLNYLWNYPNKGADNSSSFSAAPVGYKEVNGVAGGKGESIYFWSTTQKAAFNTAASVYISYVTANAYRTDESKKRGHCVRCIKD